MTKYTSTGERSSKMTKYVYSVDTMKKGMFGISMSTRLGLFSTRAEAVNFANKMRTIHSTKITIEKIDAREFGPHPF